MEKTKLIRCIYDGSSTVLVKGATYKTISEQASSYKIEIGWFSKDWFEEVKEETYDFINPNHYKQGEKETWEMMLEIWGKEAFIKHCEITAYKYIQRLGAKPNNSIEQDLEKARWYLNKAYDLKNS